MKICFIAAVVQTAVLIGHCLQIKYLLGNEEQTALKLLTRFRNLLWKAFPLSCKITKNGIDS
jgi:hypothetical protein